MTLRTGAPGMGSQGNSARTGVALGAIARAVGADVVHAGPGALETPVLGVVAADLMSDVLTVEGEDLLLVTALAAEPAVRTAHLLGLAAVLVTGRKPLPAGMKGLAQDLGVTLLHTRAPQFETCVRAGRLLDVT